MAISVNNNQLIKDWIRPLQTSLTIETVNKFINTFGREKYFSDYLHESLKKVNNLNLSEFNNGKVVISYWATWCAPCIKEMPSMKRAEKILKDYGYTFLLVSDETISKISNFKNETNFDFNFLKSNKSFETIGVYAMPTSYVFDENGKIVETFVGVIEWDSEEIINKLKML